ncbi:protein O-mannosyl-transferase TMTC1-like [Mytilus californianus]|uniref:protein O-mannosyl-transferase TMTC1-like n=1 Tax=Mytilus californianus TaxID=6549 RepID=UPI002246874D|nr:protein O-mannosyl-transferase TMTC1-like [Mytilus californianus]
MEVNNNYIKNHVNYRFIGLDQSKKYVNEVITLLVACVSFINGLHGDFLHDDIFAIKHNADVTGHNPIFNSFCNDFWGKSMSDNTSHKSYRPLTILSFRLNYFVNGHEPFYFHLVNVVLHALVSSLFTWTCQYVLYLSPQCSLLAGLLFAVHPVHVEAVTGLVGRAEVLSALLFMFSFMLYAKNLRIRKFEHFAHAESVLIFLVSIVCGILAMLCKEQGIMILPVCMLYDVFICCKPGVIQCLRNKKLCKDCLPLVKRLLVTTLIIFCLLLFRWWIMNGQLPLFQHQDNPASFSPYLVTRCLSYPYIWFYNIFILLLPSTLCYDWQVGSIPLVETILDHRNLATLFLLNVSTLFTLKWISNYKKYDSCQRTDVIFIVFLFSVLPFLPASNIVFRVGFVIAERTLYIPSTGYCILVAHGICLLVDRFIKYRHFIIAVILFLLILLLCKTWTQNKVWNSRETLFKSGVRKLPNNAKVHYNYANLLKDNGHIEDAIQEYQVAIRLYPEHASSHNNLGTILNNTTEATYHFEKALKIIPGHQGALINLGARKFKLGNKEEGVSMLHQAVEIDPHNIEALMTLGSMMAELNRWKEAEHLYSKAMTEKPDFAEVYHNYGTYLHLKGDIEEAVHYYQLAYSLDSQLSVSMVNAARGLRQIGRLNEAVSILDQALLLGRSSEALDMLGLVYYQMGRYSESVRVFEEILGVNPNNTDVMTHYAQVVANNGDVNKAEHMLHDVLHRNPNHTEALHFLSNILGQMQRHEEALVHLEQAITLQEYSGDNGELENMYFQHGNHLKDLKQYNKALVSYQKTIKLNPNKTKALLNLGAIFHLKGDFQLAVRYYEEVLKIEPHNIIALKNMEKLEKIGKSSQVT